MLQYLSTTVQPQVHIGQPGKVHAGDCTPKSASVLITATLWRTRAAHLASLNLKGHCDVTRTNANFHTQGPIQPCGQPSILFIVKSPGDAYQCALRSSVQLTGSGSRSGSGNYILWIRNLIRIQREILNFFYFLKGIRNKFWVKIRKYFLLYKDPLYSNCYFRMISIDFTAPGSGFAHLYWIRIIILGSKM